MSAEDEQDEEELEEVPAKWKCLESLLTRESPFTRTEDFVGNPSNLLMLSDARVLCVGAGGLGCELLKDLALSGFKEIHVIDLDTIDISNLNRQFLFREKDVNQPKAKIAAEFIMKRCKGVEVQWYNKPIQEFAKTWYEQFDIVIAGLDNIKARSWLNETLVDLVKFDEDGDPEHETIIPLIDGGTEGFKGQSRMFIPRTTSCFECSLASMTPQTSYPSCTIRNVPRLPEHCIIYALKVNWPRLISFNSPTDFEEAAPVEGEDEKEDLPSGPGGVTLDKDNLEHMSWLYNKATERAKQFNIPGVTFTKTQQVVKNIIPAIASTNALVSAACVNEAFKYISWTSKQLDNYFMYLGHTGISADVFRYAKNPNCRVCHKFIFAKRSKTEKFSEFCEWLSTEQKLGELKTVSNCLTMESVYLMMSGNNAFDSKQDQTIEEVLGNDSLWQVTSDITGSDKAKKVYVKFT